MPEHQSLKFSSRLFLAGLLLPGKQGFESEYYSRETLEALETRTKHCFQQSDDPI